MHPLMPAGLTSDPVDDIEASLNRIGLSLWVSMEWSLHSMCGVGDSSAKECRASGPISGTTTAAVPKSNAPTVIPMALRADG